MRVATFNIQGGRTAAGEPVDPTTYAGAIRDLDADVLALQEVDRNQPRSQGVDLTAVAAEAMGASEHRFVAALVGSPGTWTAATGEEQPDAASYGIALLSRHPVTAWEIVRLPALRMAVPMRFRGSRLPAWVRDEPRVAVAAQLDLPGGALTVANTHLSFLPWWGRRQLRALTAALRALPRPVVLLGDLNMGLERAASITGLDAAARHPTFPADHAREQLDHVLVDGALRPVASWAPRLPLSDHRALVAELERR